MKNKKIKKIMRIKNNCNKKGNKKNASKLLHLQETNSFSIVNIFQNKPKYSIVSNGKTS